MEFCPYRRARCARRKTDILPDQTFPLLPSPLSIQLTGRGRACELSSRLPARITHAIPISRDSYSAAAGLGRPRGSGERRGTGVPWHVRGNTFRGFIEGASDDSLRRFDYRGSDHCRWDGVLRGRDRVQFSASTDRLGPLFASSRMARCMFPIRRRFVVGPVGGEA